MRKAADLMRERHDAIAKILVQEQGKVYPEARAEVITSADIIDWYAEEGRRAYGRIVPGRGQGRAADRAAGAGRRRRRVHAVEFPDADAGAQNRRRARGRLLAHPQGVGRNARRLRRNGALLCRCRAAAPACSICVFGVPAEISEHLIAKDDVRKISFTGSIPVGKHLAQLAAKGMKRATMELGGHSPVVVFADADPEKSAETIAAFKYRNAGQVCISPTRFYVQEPVYDRFLARFTEYAKSIKVGDGWKKA